MEPQRAPRKDRICPSVKTREVRGLPSGIGKDGEEMKPPKGKFTVSTLRLVDSAVVHLSNTKKSGMMGIIYKGKDIEIMDAITLILAWEGVKPEQYNYSDIFDFLINTFRDEKEYRKFHFGGAR